MDSHSFFRPLLNLCLGANNTLILSKKWLLYLTVTSSQKLLSVCSKAKLAAFKSDDSPGIKLTVNLKLFSTWFRADLVCRQAGTHQSQIYTDHHESVVKNLKEM